MSDLAAMPGGVISSVVAQTLNGTATIYGPWINVPRGHVFNLFYKISSTAGTPHVDVFLDYGPFHASTLSDSSTTASYVSSTLVSDATTENILLEAAVPLVYPFVSCRMRIVGHSGNQTDTVVTAYLLKWD
jgi:hypothetical protein